MNNRINHFSTLNKINETDNECTSIFIKTIFTLKY